MKNTKSATHNQTISVKIEKMAIGGSGIARLADGFVVFVPLSAPGDFLEIQIIRHKKNYAEAKIIRILEPSPYRRSPPCPVASRCGGCQWQHITDEEQLRQKEMLVLEVLNKSLKEIFLPPPQIFKCSHSFYYRNRIQPKYQNGQIGFFSHHSNELVPTDNCIISEKLISDQWTTIRQWAQKNVFDSQLHKMEVLINTEGKLKYYFIDNPEKTHGFAQVNRFQNVELIQFVLSCLNKDSYTEVYDFFSGAGNFTFPVADIVNAPITAVDLDQKLIQRAQQQKNKNVRFICSDVEIFLQKTTLAEKSLIILDPPRTGANEKIMTSIAKSSPKKLIYISCHPVTLARDLKWFFDNVNQHYTVTQLGIFEMFPQTAHVETIIELSVDS